MQSKVFSPPAAHVDPVDTAINDLGPLAWVLDELRKSLDGAAKSLKRFMRDAESASSADELAELDTNQLRLARQQLHQAVGALEMVGLPAPALFLRAMEGAVQKFIQRPELCTPEAARKLEVASFALAEYLEAVLAGKAVSAVALFPQYRDVQQLVAADRIHPADLWHVDFRWREVQLPASNSPAEEAPARAAFDQCLLQIMRGPVAPAALRLHELCLRLAQQAAGLQQRSFWTIAAASFEALACGFFAADVHVKRAASRVLLQYAALAAQADAEVSDRLAKDLLFFCAQTSPQDEPSAVAPVLLAVRAAYGLSRWVPVNYEAIQFGRFDPALLSQARKRLAHAKESWAALAGGDGSKLKLVLDQFVQLSESLLKLHPPSQPLAQALIHAVESVVRSGSPPPVGLAMEVATSVLFLEAVFDDLDPTDERLAQRTTHLAERLEAVRRGGEPQPLAAWMEELYRRVSDKQTMGSVVGELRLSLADLEQSLDEYFRRPEDMTPLKSAPGRLAQMRGVLAVLGLDQASSAVAHMQGSVERLLIPSSPALVAADASLEASEEDVPALEAARAVSRREQVKEFDRLGNNLGALSFLIDMLNYQPALAKKLFVYEAATGELRPLMGRTLSEPERYLHADRTDATQNSPPAQAAEVTAAVAAAAVRQDAAQPAGDDMLTRQLSELATRAALADQSALAQAARQASAAVLANDPEATRVALETLAAVSPVVPQAVPQPVSPAFEEDDLQDIFLEEAREVMQAGAQAVRDLQSNSADLEALTTLRRAFHTLKGSSRMVGLHAFGEAAWSMEQLLNTWLADQKPASYDLETLTSASMQAFGEWVDAIALNQPTPWTAQAFARSADSLRAGGDLIALEVIAPSAQSTAEPETVPAPLAETETEASLEAFDSFEMALDAFDSSQAITPSIPPSARPEAPLEIKGIDFESLTALTGMGPDRDADQSGAGDPYRFAAPTELQGLEVMDFGEPQRAAPLLEGSDALWAADSASAPTQADAVDFSDSDFTAHFGAETVPAELSPTPTGSVFGAGFDKVILEAPFLRGDELTPDEAAAFEKAGRLEADSFEAVSEVDERTPLPEHAAEPVSETPAASLPEPVAMVEAEAFEVIEAAELAEPEIAAQTPETVASTQTPEHVEGHEKENQTQVERESEEHSEQQGEGDDNIKMIGSLRIGIALYNIYLNEADEWSRRLLTELSEWAIEHREPIDDATVGLAHALGGSSATVGFTALSEIARALENALQLAQLHHSRSLEAQSAATGQLFVDAAEEIRRLLHQFAAGFLKEPNPDLLDQLVNLVFAPGGIPEVVNLQPAPGAPRLVAVPTVSAPDAFSRTRAPLPVVPAVPLRPAVSRDARFDDLDDEIDAVDAIDLDLFPIFEEECAELMPQLAGALRQWTARPENQSARAEVLRGLHTLKGSARLAGALRLGEMAHRIESDIERMGSNHENLQHMAFEPLLQRFDSLQANFDALRRSGGLPPTDDAVVDSDAHAHPITATTALMDGPAADWSNDVPLPQVSAPSELTLDEALAAELSTSAMAGDGQGDAGETRGAPGAPGSPGTGLVSIPVTNHQTLEPLRQSSSGSIRVRSQLLDRMVNQAGEVMITRSRLEAELGQLRTSLGDMTGNLNRLRQQLRDIEVQAEGQMQSRLAQTKEAQQGFDPLEFDRFTRVQELTRMMAESVNDVATVQRTLQRTVEATEDDLIAQARQTRELQRDLLRTRMVEFESISDRLYRVVRFASKETGKQVRLDLNGGMQEMDRGMLDRMTPAFEHLLRNCVAHGIESPAQRAAAGKEAAGLITVSLRQDGNDVSVEFSDDGAGLDLAAIRSKAISLGLASPDETLDDQQAASMIFMPGFSTAQSVTELAGRGIGMDVVRSEVNALGGRIETTTVAGQGTRFRLMLPLTTAVTQVVMLRSGKLSMGVPSNLVETVRRASPKELQQAYNSGSMDIAGELVPFFWSGALLQSSQSSTQPQGKTLPVVVFRSAAQRIALHVDEVLGNQEVVVKNLGPQLSRLPGLAGMSVLASGAVVLIYNPVALAAVYGEQARAWGADRAEPHMLEAQARADAAGEGVASGDAKAGQAPLVLVVDDSITVRRVTQRLLQREGYRVALAADGLQALERLQEELPAVVLSDIEMPRMDGFDLARNIRHDSRLKHLPIIMITSRIAGKHKDYARELGVDHYLGKPYPEDELMSLIKHYCTGGQGAGPAASALQPITIA